MMILSNTEFPALNMAMQTPQKKQSMSCRASASPNSQSTEDNSFEREPCPVQDDEDELFECLLACFGIGIERFSFKIDHKVLTPYLTEEPIFEQLRDIRQIYQQSNMHHYLYSYPHMLTPMQRQQYVDLTIYESKILQDERTTLMIKNIPKDLTPVKLKAELDLLFKNQFDFIYMPLEQQTNQNQGYAFVNFMSPQVVMQFYLKYNGQPWIKSHSDNKICVLRYAKQQGKRDIINQLPN